MLKLNKTNLQRESDEKKKAAKKYSGTLADSPQSGRKKKAVSGKYSGAGKRVHGVRGRTRKPEDVERISEESEGGVT